MFGKLHNFLKEAFRSEFITFFQVFEPFSNSVFEPGDLYIELAQNKADIVFATP